MRRGGRLRQLTMIGDIRDRFIYSKNRPVPVWCCTTTNFKWWAHSPSNGAAVRHTGALLMEYAGHLGPTDYEGKTSGRRFKLF